MLIEQLLPDDPQARHTEDKRLMAFAEGKLVRVRCRFRLAADRTWRRGTLRLSAGRAVWTRRFASAPAITLSRGTATPVRSERRRRSMVLGYREGQFLVRRRDLAVIGRVLDLP
ncbi:MAG TPA: hypothetical protein VJ914_04920 [Pseudonocardiaceae bacterium]|nr:hypothetical protein [Pseudonocardiaceae bacterium]